MDNCIISAYSGAALQEKSFGRPISCRPLVKGQPSSNGGNLRTKRRIAALIASTTLLVAGTVVMGAGTAAAVPDFTVKFSGVSNNGSFTVAVYNNGRYAGLAEWNADHVAYSPGDAMRAVDRLADGWGVEAVLQSPYRKATTQGHDSPYITSWKTGDLPEGQTVKMRIGVVKGDDWYVSSYYAGHA
ncbi:hypothetical protein ABZX40_37930 [Streptomyces sp. NPDC004610]|uniref:hypothetical protein n=1 Tax=unclassified Streptomyces TaxID=2593676 RepID=UPI0033A8D953